MPGYPEQQPNQPSKMKIPAIALFVLTATSSSVVRPVRAVGFPGLGQTINGPTEAVAIDPNSATTSTAGAASSVLRGSSNDGGEAEIGDDVDDLRRGGGGTVAGFDPTDAKSSCKGSKTSQLTCDASAKNVYGDVELTEGLVCNALAAGGNEAAFIIHDNVDCKGNLIIGPGGREMPDKLDGIAFILKKEASIKNCVISGFGVAIRVEGKDVSVKNVIIMNSNYGVDIAPPSGSEGKFSFKDIRITNFYYGIFMKESQPSNEYVFQDIKILQPSSVGHESALEINGDIKDSKITIDKLDATGDGDFTKSTYGVVFEDFSSSTGAEIKITNSVVQGWGDACLFFEIDDENSKITIENTLAAGCGESGIEIDPNRKKRTSFHVSETSSVLNGGSGSGYGIDVSLTETGMVVLENVNVSGNYDNGIVTFASEDIKITSTLIQNNDNMGLEGSTGTEVFVLGEGVKICHNDGINNGVYDTAKFSGKDPVCEETSTLPVPDGGDPVNCRPGCTTDSNIAALASCVEITIP